MAKAEKAYILAELLSLIITNDDTWKPETNGKIPNKYKCENDDSLLERVLPAQKGNLMPYLSEKR